METNLNQGMGLMFARLLIQWGGVYLAARGFGDEAFWTGMGGLGITAFGLLTSLNSRRNSNKNVATLQSIIASK